MLLRKNMLKKFVKNLGMMQLPILAEFVVSSMSLKERDLIVKNYRKQQVQILVNEKFLRKVLIHEIRKLFN